MKRVLLTGATGFIGQHCLSPLLAHDYEVHAVSSKIQPVENSNVRWHRADLLDPVQVAAVVHAVRPTHLLHLAWYVEHQKFWTSSENMRWVQASLQLLQAFVCSGGQRVVMAGTCAEYDWNYGYCSEAVTPLMPTSLYGTCKHSLQLMLRAYAEQHDLSAAWGRVFFLYGPYEHPQKLIASVIQSLWRGEVAKCSHGHQIRDFLHVQDVADAFVALLDSHVEGAINIASGQAVTIKDVVLRIGQQMDRADLIHFGALQAAVNEPPLLVADVRRLTAGVRWYPAYDLNAGLEQTITWWKDHIR